MQSARGSISTHGSWMMEHNREYKLAGKTLWGLEEELHGAQALPDTASKGQAKSATIRRLKDKMKTGNKTPLPKVK